MDPRANDRSRSTRSSEGEREWRYAVLPKSRRMKAWLAALLTLAPLPALADGPALAHLTIDGRTITLTAQSDHPFSGHEEPTRLNLRFAQLHLGFPMPPFLNLSLEARDGDWTVTDLSLERTSSSSPIVFSPDGLWISEVSGNAPDLRFIIEGEGMAPSRAPIPVHIETHLRSP